MNPIELPIKKAFGVVNMKSHQVERDYSNGGRTSRAAARLAAYRLRRFLVQHGRAAISDTTLHVHEDLPRGTRDVVAEARCIDRLELDVHGVDVPIVKWATSVHFAL